jgi:hypothetical protein
VVAPIPGLALAGAILLAPYGVDAKITAMMTAVAGDPGREQLAIWAGMLFSLTVLPAVFAIGWVSRRHSPRLVLAGGTLSAVGFGVGFSLPDSGAGALVARREGLDLTKVSAISDAIFAEPLTTFTPLVFVIGTSVGLLLLGVAMWRSRVARRWLAVALALSGPAHVLQPAGTWGPRSPGCRRRSAASAPRSPWHGCRASPSTSR